MSQGEEADDISARKHSTPKKSSHSTKNDSPHRNIQVNLSKEYFSIMADQNDQYGGAAISPRRNADAQINDDNWSDLLPSASTMSSPKGIIKNISNKKDISLSSTSVLSQRSPKKVRITEPAQNESLANVQCISEVEDIRKQLKNVIGLTQSQADTSTSSQHFPGDTIPGNTSHITKTLGESSAANYDPTNIFKGILSYASPPLQMDENGVMRMDAFSGSGRGSRDLISPQTDRSLLIEISMLKDNLEKEQQRRKHCEIQIQNLQKKILELQQQLAVAVATDKKKAIMIDQLDKTLARVVGGWKKHESERIASIERLRNENSTLRKSQNRQEDILAQFEGELSKAVESLTKEQSRAKAAEEEKLSQLKRHQNEREEAFQKLEKERELVRNLEATIDELQNDNQNANQQIEEKIHSAAIDREAWMEERSDLQNELERAKSQFQSELEGLQESLSTTQKDAQDVLSRYTSLQHEYQRKDIELDTVLREKESLKMEVSLLEAKLEAVKTKQESEQTEKLQEEFNRRINLIQQEILKTESELKNSHKEQILDLNKKHKEDLEKQLRRFHEELRKSEDMLQDMKDGYEKQLQDAQHEIATLIESKRDLESQRKELIRRLQSMMQQHMQEAVSLINLEPDGYSERNTDSHLKNELNRLASTSHTNEYSTSKVNALSFLSSMTEAKRNSDSIYTQNSFNQGQQPKHVENSRFTTRGSEFEGSTHNQNFSSEQNIHGFREPSNSGPWSQFQEMESPGKQFDPSFFNSTSSTVSTSQEHAQFSHIDALSDRQERFQTGLQELSDKLRISAKIGSNQASSYQDDNLLSQEPRLVKQSQEKDTWMQVQALLRSKMEEVESDNHTVEDTETTLKEQLIETAYESPRKNRKNVSQSSHLEEKIQEQETRQSQLTNFIKQLLNKSPGHPTGNTDDECEEQVDGLPLGSDMVSRDSQINDFKTPPKVPSTRQLSRAFKKSVLKEKPGMGKRDSIDERTLASSAQRSPSNKLTSEEKKKKEQLNYLMQAIGIHADTSMQDLDGMIQLLQNAQKSVSQEKSKGSKFLPSKQQDSNASKPLIGNQPNRPQPHKQQSKNPKGRPDDVFTRLQRIYGNAEEVKQGVQRGTGLPAKNTLLKNVVKSQANHPAKQSHVKPKEQRKGHSPRGSVEKLPQAWK